MELFTAANVKLDYAKRKFSFSLTATELIVSGSHIQLVWLLKKHPVFCNNVIWKGKNVGIFANGRRVEYVASTKFPENVK